MPLLYQTRRRHQLCHKSVPGTENGTIFSHLNPCTWCAEAVLGRGNRAMKFYNALCPALQNDKIEIHRAEPYSSCRFVVGKAHTAFGKARHPFMTGSSGWAYHAVIQHLLGVRPAFDALTVEKLPVLTAGSACHAEDIMG